MTRRCLDLCSGLGGFSAAFRDADEWDVTTVEWYDAVPVRHVTASLQSDVPIAVAQKTFVARADPVEVKSAKVSTSNGTGQTPGRWYLRRTQHDRLVDSRGWYALTVYDERERADGTERSLLAVWVVPAETIDEFLDWHDTGRGVEAAKVAWPRVVPVDLREVGGGS